MSINTNTYSNTYSNATIGTTVSSLNQAKPEIIIEADGERIVLTARMLKRMIELIKREFPEDEL